MHGGQAIPAFDFYLAPYVRMSYIEELKALEDLNGEDYSSLYDEPLMDYVKKPLDGLTGRERAQQHAINKTVVQLFEIGNRLAIAIQRKQTHQRQHHRLMTKAQRGSRLLHAETAVSLMNDAAQQVTLRERLLTAI